MILPAFFGLFNELSFLVVVGSFSGLASYMGTWSLPNVFPAIADESEADTALTCAFLVTAVIFLFALVCLLGIPLPEKIHEITLWSALLTPTQSVYLIMTSVAVRDQDYDTISLARLLLGTTSFAATLTVCLLASFQASLVLAAITSFLVAAIAMALRKRLQWLPAVLRGVRSGPYEWYSHLRKYWSINAASLAVVAAFHITNISIIGLKQFSNAWAVLARISGGFGTTAQYIFAPMYEMSFARGIRDNDTSAAKHSQSRGLQAGMALGLIASLTAIVTAFTTGAMESLSEEDSLALAIASFVYINATLVTAIVAKNVTLAGGKKHYLIWATLKASIGVTILILLSGTSLLIALVLNEALFQIFYVIIARTLLAGRPSVQNQK